MEGDSVAALNLPSTADRRDKRAPGNQRSHAGCRIGRGVPVDRRGCKGVVLYPGAPHLPAALWARATAKRDGCRHRPHRALLEWTTPISRPSTTLSFPGGSSCRDSEPSSVWMIAMTPTRRRRQPDVTCSSVSREMRRASLSHRGPWRRLGQIDRATCTGDDEPVPVTSW